jgi:hypothetical protein
VIGVGGGEHAELLRGFGAELVVPSLRARCSIAISGDARLTHGFAGAPPVPHWYAALTLSDAFVMATFGVADHRPSCGFPAVELRGSPDGGGQL